MKVGLKILGNWRKEVGVPLGDALAVSMDVMLRNGKEACKHAMILMAQSARALTKKAKANRPIKTNNAGAEYVEIYRQGERPFRRYKFQYDTDDPKWKAEGTWKDAKRIPERRRGLAKRSWMWGLAKLKPGMHTGWAIPGLSKVWAITGTQWSGYIKENRLPYVQKIMGPGWEAKVTTTAGNKIMAQARNKIESKWRREMGLPRRGRKEAAQDSAFLARYFLKGAA